MNRKTISEKVHFEGVGLHTGKHIKMDIYPSAEVSGIKFIRTDLSGAHVYADVSNVSATNRSTTLKSGDAMVSTIEHLMSAINSLGITDLLIEIDGSEVPILDGSAFIFADKLASAGIMETEIEKEIFEIDEIISYQDENTGATYFAYPADNFQVTAIIEFSQDSLGEQSATLKSIDDFKEQIAPCRTFVLLSELEKLADSGLIKGGDLDNAIVIADKKLSDTSLDNLRVKLNKPHVQITENGILNNVKLKFKNEPARHKLLDLIGDISLIGKEIKGHIVARRPGHTSNIAFAKILKAKFLEQKRLKGKPKYDPNKEPVMDAEKIKSLLPHRYPFLLVDKVTEISDTYIVGIKNVTINESFFQGHFPGNPVFPGVLQMEALAQTGGILALSLAGDMGVWDTYFLKMDNVKFKARVNPGDTLILKMELLDPMKRGIVRMMGTAYVGNKLVSEGELTAQIIKRKDE